MSSRGVFRTGRSQVEQIEYLQVDNQAQSACVFLHGYGASMSDLYDLHQLSANCDWYFPNAPIAVPIGPMMEGRAWFPIDMQELQIAMQTGNFRDFGSRKSIEFDAAQDALLEFLLELKQKYANIIVGGFSQGAMMASHLFSRVQAQGLVIMSGVGLDREALVAKLQAASETGYKISFIQGHGAQDPVLEYAQAKILYELLQSFGHQGEFVSFEGGHEIAYPFYQRIKLYLDSLA